MAVFQLYIDTEPISLYPWHMFKWKQNKEVIGEDEESTLAATS